MQLSNTTDQSGLVQRVERLSRRPYGSSGDELREIINDLNNAFEKIIPVLLLRNDLLRWDDINHTDKPVGTFDIVANQNDYKIATDDNSLDILNIIGVRVIHETGDTQYIDLERITPDDRRVPEILNPNTTVTGQPTGFLELGNVIYFDILPESAVTAGGEVMFQRQQAYFTVTGTSDDDTTEPGIPLPFHDLLAHYAALDWVMVNRTDDGNLINLLRSEIQRMEEDLTQFIDTRNPTHVVATTRAIDYGVRGTRRINPWRQ
jgi:hypothetical protein